MSKLLSIQEQQQAELEVMKALHAYCEKHHIRYSLGWGSLLGAIRHKGFIPWDNDMDIYMLREDTERLKKLAKTDPIGPNIKLFDMSSDPNYHYVVLRACNMDTIARPSYLRKQINNMGLWVDIFPMDGYNKTLYWFQRPIAWFFTKLCYATMYRIPTNQKAKRIVQKVILRFLPNKNHRYERRLDSISRWFNTKKSKYLIAIHEDDFKAKASFPKDDLMHPHLVLHNFLPIF